MPQFVTLPLLAGGQGVVNVAALVIQLVAYPLMLGVGALKAQVLQTMVATFIRNPGSEFTETAELIVKALQLSPQKGSQKAVAVEKALVGAFVIGLALAFVFGLKLHADGVNLGVFVGLLEGSLLTTTVFAYVHLLALLAVNLRQVSLYDRLIDDTDLEEVDYKATHRARCMIEKLQFYKQATLKRRGEKNMDVKKIVSRSVTFLVGKNTPI